MVIENGKVPGKWHCAITNGSLWSPTFYDESGRNVYKNILRPHFQHIKFDCKHPSAAFIENMDDVPL